MAMLYSVDEFDFDKDGQNEAILTFAAGVHSSGAKVIRFTDDGYKYIFEHGSSAPNVEYKVIDDVPTFIFEESDYEPDYASGKRYEERYVWNGADFLKAPDIHLGVENE